MELLKEFFGQLEPWQRFCLLALMIFYVTLWAIISVVWYQHRHPS